MEAKGFTLIEMMLSVAIIALLTGLSWPLYTSFATRNDLMLTAQKTADATRRAESYARNGNQDSGWGILITTTAVTVFKGATYATRDSTFDESFPIPANITETGGGEIDFAKLSGAPSASSAVTFTDPTGSTRTINLTTEGTVWM